jgi:hypothetical protein
LHRHWQTGWNYLYPKELHIHHPQGCNETDRLIAKQVVPPRVVWLAPLLSGRMPSPGQLNLHNVRLKQSDGRHGKADIVPTRASKRIFILSSESVSDGLSRNDPCQSHQDETDFKMKRRQ